MDEFECSTCGGYYNIDRLKYCQCGSQICIDCSCKRKEIITLKEWLDSVPNQCDKCKIMCCANCIRTCYTCGNLGNSQNNLHFMCDKCSDVIKLDCKYHKWYICSKCIDNSKKNLSQSGRRCNYELNEMLEDLHLSKLPIEVPDIKPRCPECISHKNYHYTF